MKKILISVIILLVVATGSIIYNNNKPSGTVQIGGLYPLTGGLASYGEPARNVAMIAVEDVNAAGGINGKKLELITEDHKCDPKETNSVFQKLYDINHIRVFTSVACSGTALSLAPN